MTPSTSQINELEPKVTSKGYKVESQGSSNLAKGMPHPYPLPRFNSKEEEIQQQKEHMACAFRIFGRLGFAEGVGLAGHFTLRDGNTFWINPLGKHFSLMKVSDFVHVDEEGNILPDGNQAAINNAGFSIHSAIHKARPDVNAACHFHSPYGKSYSALGLPLDMINQDVCIFYKNHSVFTDFGGVAFDPNEGIAIAKSIGNGKGAILQNHGIITVGKTVDETAFLYMLMENSCRCQILANSALKPGDSLKIIKDDVAAYTEEMTGDPETLYGEFQPDYELELMRSNGDFLK
ncbi:hypothetical protein QCA50_017094 [Cerrena zonata]|uniref:Class II aldolase/adducin N-terminal domain-containing protein n=1 Tax=Cerrena zonata TaxID=2478898 RepID=A0AAW0FK55_9APHY